MSNLPAKGNQSAATPNLSAGRTNATTLNNVVMKPANNSSKVVPPAPTQIPDNRAVIVFDLDDTIYGKFPSHDTYGRFAQILGHISNEFVAKGTATFEKILSESDKIDETTEPGKYLKEHGVSLPGFCPGLAFYLKIYNTLYYLYREKQRSDSGIAAIILYSNNSIDLLINLVHKRLIQLFNGKSPGDSTGGLPPLFDVVMGFNSTIRNSAGDEKHGSGSREKTLKGVEEACKSIGISTSNLKKRTFLFDDNETSSLAAEIGQNYIRFLPDEIPFAHHDADASIKSRERGAYVETLDGYETSYVRFRTILGYLSSQEDMFH